MKLDKTISLAVRLFGSKRFFWFVLGIFIFQAGWIALTGRYPQAFDEQFHFLDIQLHAQQWSPFFAAHPAGADSLGAVARDPSLTYHYLMSFPYRLISAVFQSQTIQIILLRFINVALFVWGFVVFRKLLAELSISDAKANLLILFTTLLPVVPLLAGQLNYDNLVLPLSGLSLLWALRIYKGSLATGRVDWLALLRLVTLMTLACSVKYSFLPIFAGVVLFFVPVVWRKRRALPRELTSAMKRLSRPALVGYLLSVGFALWLFAGGIGYNLVKYQAVQPRCEAVVTLEQCSHFGPWARDYPSMDNTKHPPVSKLLHFPVDWVGHMLYETYFTIYSNFRTNGTVAYHARMPIQTLITLGWVWFWLCFGVLIISLRALWGDGRTRLLLLVSLVYVAALFYTNFMGYYEKGYATAIHGRYVFPVLVPLLACFVIGADKLRARFTVLRSSQTRTALGVLVVLSLLVFTQGGGFVTYMVRSDDKWFWQQSEAAQRSNEILRNSIQPLVFGE